MAMYRVEVGELVSLDALAQVLGTSKRSSCTPRPYVVILLAGASAQCTVTFYDDREGSGSWITGLKMDRAYDRTEARQHWSAPDLSFPVSACRQPPFP